MKTVPNEILRLGIDIGSTTLKAVVLDSMYENTLFTFYARHYSNTRETVIALLNKICDKFPDSSFSLAASGSGAVAVAEQLGIPFIQEVIASTHAIKKYIPHTDVAIELGGEDAKITFFDKGGVDQRMNETCAGGTGAFIDQMSFVLKTDAAGLDALALNHKDTYSISARCGVFAKMDILPLLNEGAPKENIAASIFQAVVEQTIGGLACGRSIKGNVAFLGGPLTFLPQLRQAFIKTLKLGAENIIEPTNAQYFVCLGAALLCNGADPMLSQELKERIKKLQGRNNSMCERHLDPLFYNRDDYEAFEKRHSQSHAEFAGIIEAHGELFLGIDAGSTTTKAVAIDANKTIYYSWYGPNNGNPLLSAVEVLKDLYSKLPPGTRIKAASVTGYGENLLKTALNIDFSEVETVAHYRASAYFNPDVSFILDIGGQDMKCIHVRNGVIDKIILNEACSSGCGSFIETFSGSLGIPIDSFVEQALKAEAPIDLGSRCTVFMNSKVKQAQAEGASIGDISAGLAYSVIRNALYKVIKIADTSELGEHILVQGGTFLNNAVLRALEKLIKRNVVRPNIAGIMGAFGSALNALEESQHMGELYSSIISKEKLEHFHFEQKTTRCEQCHNNCALSINILEKGNRFISGNRCERCLDMNNKKTNASNLYDYKTKRLFDYYKPLDKDRAYRGEIGIPRALNIYENYPLWFTLLTNLGFRVVLSDSSSKAMYKSGIETISSQTICYPAKMVHGHINNLVKKGVKTIFYPCIPHESKEFSDSHNNYNCPVVSSYPEVIRLNMDIINHNGITFLQPFLPITDAARLTKRLLTELGGYNISKGEMKNAVKAGLRELERFRGDIRDKGARLVKELQEKNMIGIILAGRPYHLDPAVNHGIPEKISSEGIAVLTEDSIAHLGTKLMAPLSVTDQWVYHSRLYRAANFAAHTKNLEFVQLNSFGCGIDAITTEQTEEILLSAGKSCTLLKIDEGSNLSVIWIRIRSLLATIKKRSEQLKLEYNHSHDNNNLHRFKPDYTILCPQMSPIHFEFLQNAFAPEGLKIEVIPRLAKPLVIEEGLRYVNNDACYPAIIVVGEIIAALKSGVFDINRTAVIITQTIGGCRATNYITFLRLALKKAGFSNIPILPLNLKIIREITSIKLKGSTLKRLMFSISYADLLLRLSNATRPYEKSSGSADRLVKIWSEKIKIGLAAETQKKFIKNIYDIVHDFDEIEINDIKKPKVGIVGEIFIKYHPGANNELVSLIENEGAEAVVPDLIEFINYCLLDDVFRHMFLDGGLFIRIVSSFTNSYIEYFFRRPIRKALGKSKRFHPGVTTRALSKKASTIVSNCNQSGEGWLLSAEMLELIESGTPNIICVQPFGCLPNHITGKGVVKEIKSRFKQANILILDYDPGTSAINQYNRIKLMIGMIPHNSL